jgi:PAS domain S-box-containing protein
MNPGLAEIKNGDTRLASHAATRRRSVLPWVVLVIGVPASIWLFLVLQDAVENVARLRFERQASDAKGVIEVRINYYANVLYGLKALFAASPSVNRVDFHRFVNSLDLPRRYPGLDVVNFATYVLAAEKQRFEQAVRSDTSLHPAGYPQFAIKPPGDRPEYHVIVYLEPMDGYAFAFGLDLGANPAVSGTDPKGLAALQHAARDSGKLTSSGLPIRIKAQKDYIGLAMRLAVYRSGMPVETIEQRRAAYLGSVGAGFNVQQLMKGAVDNELARFIRFKLYDAGSATDRSEATASAPERLLFDSAGAWDPSSGKAEDTARMFSRVLPMELGGRIWEIHFSAQKRHALEPVDALLPWVVLLGGMLSSGLLFGVLSSLASSRSRALAIANDITKNLRHSEASLAEAQRMAHLGNWSYDPATRLMKWSAETCRIFGLAPSKAPVAFEDFLQRMHDEDRANVRQALVDAIAAKKQHEMEHRIYAYDGTARWVHTIVQATARDADAPVRGTMMDITEQKRTQDALRASAEQLTALSRRLVEVQEAERRKLSRELHDRVGQNLTALSINLDILRTSLKGNEFTEHRARLSDSAALLESTVDSIEDVMAELRPPMLDDYGLLPAMHWYAKDFSRRTGIEISVSGTDGLERPDAEMEITLFRIAQEALTNVAKHAHATRAQIELDETGGRCRMTVRDDGVGIDGTGRERPGLGMVTMRERAQAVGGDFEVRNAPGGGAYITVEIPAHGHTHTDR